MNQNKHRDKSPFSQLTLPMSSRVERSHLKNQRLEMPRPRPRQLKSRNLKSSLKQSTRLSLTGTLLRGEDCSMIFVRLHLPNWTAS